MSKLTDNLRNIFKIEELKQRIIYTVGLLVIVRLGAHITLPGIDVVALKANQGSGGAADSLFGLYDLFVGGAFENAAIFALGIMPSISASIIIQWMGSVVPYFQKLQKGDVSQNLKLEPFDSIVIPAAELVYVQGEVRAPGALKYTTDLTLSKAMALVGGTTPMAAPGRVELLRSEGQKKVRMKLDLDKILRAPEDNPDIKLRPDDIVFVPQRLF